MSTQVRQNMHLYGIIAHGVWYMLLFHLTVNCFCIDARARVCLALLFCHPIRKRYSGNKEITIYRFSSSHRAPSTPNEICLTLTVDGGNVFIHFVLTISGRLPYLLFALNVRCLFFSSWLLAIRPPTHSFNYTS